MEFFGEPFSCVFCGSLDVRRWDHLIAVTHGGETVLGNMVPACASCDDSKQHKQYEEWMRARASTLGMSNVDLERRVAKLNSLPQHFGYVHTSLQQRLTNEEQSSLTGLHLELAGMKAQIEELIARYRKRVGSL